MNYDQTNTGKFDRLAQRAIERAEEIRNVTHSTKAYVSTRISQTLQSLVLSSRKNVCGTISNLSFNYAEQRQSQPTITYHTDLWVMPWKTPHHLNQADEYSLGPVVEATLRRRLLFLGGGFVELRLSLFYAMYIYLIYSLVVATNIHLSLRFRTTSKINGRAYVPFLDYDLREKFAFPIQYTWVWCT